MVTLDAHLAGAVERARASLARELPALELNFHAAASWGEDPAPLERCCADIARADLIFVSMLFTDDHIQAVLPALEARRDGCDGIVCILSAPQVSALTRIGSFDMRSRNGGGLSWLKKLRGGSSESSGSPSGPGARQMAMLRKLPQLLRFIPGTAQDLRAYLLAMNYWLLGSDVNIQNLIRVLISRYACPERLPAAKKLKAEPPVFYPEVGVYHPDLPGRIAEDPSSLPRLERPAGRVGVLLMRSYLLAANTRHYDRVIHALTEQGLEPVPAFSSSLDARPAIERCFLDGEGRPLVDAVVSLTGFSLVGGPAYNDAGAAVELLRRLDVPYLSAQALEFQSLADWEANPQGLLPLETVMMVSIPELDGATATMVYGGRGIPSGSATTTSKGGIGPAGHSAHDMLGHAERIEVLAQRLSRLVRLRRSARAERRLGVVLFNFPPNSGGVGSAAHLAVFESLHNLLARLAAEGYGVEVPESVDALRTAILDGNSATHGTDANVAAHVELDDYVRREPHLAELEAQWGPAPGRLLTDGRRLHVLGARFGNVFVGVQPGFGIEGDPMRLMFEGGHAPTHAFSAFYRYLREDFDAHAVLHFGTHGALEFMPGKQVGLSGACWPERLIGSLPNYYLYAANNPSEGTIAKRRANATVITHLTPPLAQSGLYRDLQDLQALLDEASGCAADSAERQNLIEVIGKRAAELELGVEDAWDGSPAQLQRLTRALAEIRDSLIPQGLHVLGRTPSVEARASLISAMAEADGVTLDDIELERLARGDDPTDSDGEHAGAARTDLDRYLEFSRRLADSDELTAVVRALDGRYVPPVAGGDLLGNPDILPTGRNIHGFDPTRLPSALACEQGRRQAECLLSSRIAESGSAPAMIAMVLWGTDNLKTEGASLAQALALMGARPRFDSYGRLAGAELVPLAELGRPRVDVLVTLSGIFRDLLPAQIRLLAEAALLAAQADEPLGDNPIRRHALAYQHARGCSLEAAAMRVFSNDHGAYGANVNLLVDSGLWEESDELGNMFARRKCFAYGVDSRTSEHRELMTSLFADVELTYQNLDSVELGVTTVDHYFDSLGGISKAVELARGAGVPTYIGDQTQGRNVVRSLADQVALETRTRLLNPRWYEELLAHGHEGVHQLQVHITNTVGWSATTGQVAPWVYDQLSKTFVLDDEMRERLASLNPAASLKVANRLLEAHDRNYWSAEASALEALRRAEESLEDRLEGINMKQGATA